MRDNTRVNDILVTSTSQVLFTVHVANRGPRCRTSNHRDNIMHWLSYWQLLGGYSTLCATSDWCTAARSNQCRGREGGEKGREGSDHIINTCGLSNLTVFPFCVALASILPTLLRTLSYHYTFFILDTRLVWWGSCGHIQHSVTIDARRVPTDDRSMTVAFWIRSLLFFTWFGLHLAAGTTQVIHVLRAATLI
jgi:hypothetical protein